MEKFKKKSFYNSRNNFFTSKSSNIQMSQQSSITPFLATPSPNTPHSEDSSNLLTNKRTRIKQELFSRVMFLKRNSHHFATIYPPA